MLDALTERGKGAEFNIIVTQPRRVSAMGVAARVAAERGERLDASSGAGQNALVGYAIRGERRASRDCRLLFTTTGVLLRRLSAGGDPDLTGFSHIIVDEVHERNVDSDFLLLELREVLKRNSKLKVVLMSATIQQVRLEAVMLLLDLALQLTRSLNLTGTLLQLLWRRALPQYPRTYIPSP